VRPWLERLEAAGGASLGALNCLAEETGIHTESGRPVRFVAPSPTDPYYEVRVFESGCVQTRPDNRHDMFNALAWLAFPSTKARINALHATHMRAESGERGRFRDLLTIFDEGGAIVQCVDSPLIELMRACRWGELFWRERARVLDSFRITVLGHAVLEQAVEPWPGITCKAIFVEPGQEPDMGAACWLGTLPADATPRDMAALPIFGFPGWFPGNDDAAFYQDTRYFRPFSRHPVAVQGNT
jgi:hypothetical protein